MSGPGGVPSPGGCLLPGGSSPRGCLVETPLTATAAGGMHPTGMHSCEIMGFRVLRFPNA